MRIFMYCLLLMIPILLTAQEKDKTQKEEGLEDELKHLLYRDIMNHDAGLPGLVNGFSLPKKAKGSVFFFENWSPVQVISKKGDVFTTNGKYNIQADELQFLDKNKKVKVAKPAEIRGFILSGTIFITSLTKNQKHVFCEVISYGALPLLAKHQVILVNDNDNPVMGSVHEVNKNKTFKKSEKLFYEEKGIIYKLKKSKKKILKLMIAEEEKITKAMERNKSNLKKRGGFKNYF